MIIIDRSRLHPLGRSSNRSMPCVRSHPMKDVTERLEGEAPTRRVFQQQLFMTLAVSTVLCSVQAAPQGPEALGSKLTPGRGDRSECKRGYSCLDAAWTAGRGMELRPGARRALEVQGRQAALQHRREQSRATLEQAVPGQVELFKRIPGYRMDVYPTRRTCSAPDFVVENTRQNVGFAKLDAAGLALDEAHVPGIRSPCRVPVPR